jgi:hypothetical protein
MVMAISSLKYPVPGNTLAKASDGRHYTKRRHPECYRSPASVQALMDIRQFRDGSEARIAALVDRGNSKHLARATRANHAIGGTDRLNVRLSRCQDP